MLQKKCAVNKVGTKATVVSPCGKVAMQAWAKVFDNSWVFYTSVRLDGGRTITQVVNDDSESAGAAAAAVAEVPADKSPSYELH